MAPDDSMSCWEKAHSFYIPKGLFVAGPCHQESSSKEKLKFANAAVSSECYLAKRRAFGLAVIKHGGKRGGKRGGGKR
jgi:hypothetical protein